MRGDYRCVVNAKSPLAGRESIALEDLRDYIFAFTHVKGLTEGDWTSASMFRTLFSILPASHILEVESLTNVFSLLRKNPEVFYLGFYPMVTAWDAVARGELVHIPILRQNTGGKACLFYAERAYLQHPAVRALVEEIRAAARALADRLLKPEISDRKGERRGRRGHGLRRPLLCRTRRHIGAVSPFVCAAALGRARGAAA